MSQCSNCHRELPGFETLCLQCFEAGYERVMHPKQWWQRVQLRPQFARNNIIGFSVLFGFAFVLLRFDFPYFHARHMRTTEISVLLSTLFACIAFFHGQEKSQPASVPPRVKREIDWRRFGFLAAAEIAAGIVLYALFTVTSEVVLAGFVMASFVIFQIDIFDPKRNRSIGSLLGIVTAVLATVCFAIGNATHRDVWTRLMFVGFSLQATLIALDRWADL